MSVATTPDGTVVLSDRELAVLRGMAQGRTNAAIGREQFLSVDTVKTHARRLFRKLGAVDRANAVAIAYQRGILPLHIAAGAA